MCWVYYLLQVYQRSLIIISPTISFVTNFQKTTGLDFNFRSINDQHSTTTTPPSNE